MRVYVRKYIYSDVSVFTRVQDARKCHENLKQRISNVNVRVSASACANMYVRTYVRKFVNMSTCVYVRTYVRVYAREHLSTYKCKIHVYVFMFQMLMDSADMNVCVPRR